MGSEWTYRLLWSSSLPWPSVMLSPRMMKARVSEGAQISTALTKYLPVRQHFYIHKQPRVHNPPARKLLPMDGAPIRHFRLTNSIAIHHPRRRPAPRVPRNLSSRLSSLKIHRQREVRAGLDSVVNWIRVDGLARGDYDRSLPAKGELGEGRRIDATHAGGSALRKRDGGCRDGELGCAKDVGDLDA